MNNQAADTNRENCLRQKFAVAQKFRGKKFPTNSRIQLFISAKLQTKIRNSEFDKLSQKSVFQHFQAVYLFGPGPAPQPKFPPAVFKLLLARFAQN